MSKCDREDSIMMKPGPLRAIAPCKKKISQYKLKIHYNFVQAIFVVCNVKSPHSSQERNC